MKTPRSASEAIALDAGFIEAHINLGNVHQEREQLELAVKHYNDALAIDADSVEALINLGTALQDQDRPEDAEECYRKEPER